MSIPGTAHSVITVSAIDACKPIVIGDFSSFGPTRDGRRKPDVAAPGVNVMAARGGTFDEAVQMSSTSMAAPHVTGGIALLLSRPARSGQEWPTATQIGAVLRQKTSNYNGLWTEGQGYGVIDVPAILNAFDYEQRDRRSVGRSANRIVVEFVTEGHDEGHRWLTYLDFSTMCSSATPTVTTASGSGALSSG